MFRLLFLSLQKYKKIHFHYTVLIIFMNTFFHVIDGMLLYELMSGEKKQLFSWKLQKNAKQRRFYAAE